MDNYFININPENIDKLYKKINNLIDKYFEFDIKPSDLKNYLTPGNYGIKKFIKLNKLTNIKGIEKIITDVIDDRYSMEMDRIMTFENYNSGNLNTNLNLDLINEHSDILFKNLEYPSEYFNNIISDYFKTSPSHIESKNKQLHKYQVTGLKLHSDIIIFSKEDINGSIRNNLIEYIKNYLMNKHINIITIGIKKRISELLNDEDININIKEKEIIVTISEILKNDGYHLISEDYYKGYLIWEK